MLRRISPPANRDSSPSSVNNRKIRGKSGDHISSIYTAVTPQRSVFERRAAAPGNPYFDTLTSVSTAAPSMERDSGDSPEWSTGTFRQCAIRNGLQLRTPEPFRPPGQYSILPQPYSIAVLKHFYIS